MRAATIDHGTIAGTVARHWWALVLRGLAGIFFGLVTFFAPGISLAALVILFGAYAFADGVFSLVAAARRHGTSDHWWALLLEGISGVAAGILTLVWPGITAIALLYLIAAWAIVTGALEIAAAIRLRKVIDHEWLLALSGTLSVGLGVLLFLFPGVGMLSLVLWIGAYAFVSGVILIMLGVRLHSWTRSHPPREAFSAA
jgi:uncharacterized membrane protein HdeD (DUF308 family)